MNSETFAPWPPSPTETALRAKLAAIEALCARARSKDGRVPCALIEKALAGEEAT